MVEGMKRFPVDPSNPQRICWGIAVQEVQQPGPQVPDGPAAS